MRTDNRKQILDQLSHSRSTTCVEKSFGTPKDVAVWIRDIAHTIKCFYVPLPLSVHAFRRRPQECLFNLGGLQHFWDFSGSTSSILEF